jgi:hypothetical protein
MMNTAAEYRGALYYFLDTIQSIGKQFLARAITLLKIAK